MLRAWGAEHTFVGWSRLAFLWDEPSLRPSAGRRAGSAECRGGVHTPLIPWLAPGNLDKLPAGFLDPALPFLFHSE